MNTIRRCRYSKSELPQSRIIGNKISDEEAKRKRNTKPFSKPVNSAPKSSSIDEQEADESDDIDTKRRNREEEKKWKYVISFFGFMFAQLVSHDMGSRALVKNPGKTNIFNKQ